MRDDRGELVRDLALALELADVADGITIRVSGLARLDDAHVGVAALREFEAAGLGDAYRSITERCWRPVGYADFWGHMLVAEGALDVMIEPELNLWDVAALQPI